jgi:Ca2+-binding EF-hand superfamily protein
VNSHSFISEFLRLGNVERKRKLLYQQKVTKKLEQNKEKYSIERERSLERLSLYSLAVSYSDEEAKSAYEKFSLMALTHDPQNPTPLLGFVNGGEMTPKEFKEQLRRSFHLQLSSGEIASLVHHFDSNENGLIDCHEFIRAFYQISFHERIQHNAKHQKIQNRLATQRLHHQHEVSQKFLSRAQVELKVPTDKTRHSTVQKLQLMALQYDSKQSSVQWGNMFKVFESSKITIKHFHEIIKRQFCLSFNSSELGVIYEMFHLPTSTRQVSGKQQSRHEGRGRGGQRGRLRERDRERQGYGEKAHILEEEDEEEQEEEENNEEEVSPFSQPQSSRSRSPLTDGSCVIDCQKFLSYFFQLCKVEKQKFTDQHLFLNRKLQQRKENYEKNLVKKLVRQKETTVSYPELPNVNLSMEFNASISSSAQASAVPLFTPTYSSSSQQQQLQQSSLESSMAFLDDPNGAGRPVTSSARRPTRKLSVLDTIAPNRHVLKLFKQEKSLVNLYPLASEDTKVFSLPPFFLFGHNLSVLLCLSLSLPLPLSCSVELHS